MIVKMPTTKVIIFFILALAYSGPKLLLVRAEEQSAMTGMSCSLGPECDGNFLMQTYASACTLTFAAETKVHTVFVMGDHYDGYESVLGISKIFVNSLADPSTGTVSRDNVSASGWYALITPTTGTKLMIKKFTAWAPQTMSSFYMNELRFYQVPNIISFGGTSITADTTPQTNAQYAATNLINNLDSRCANSNQRPYIASGTQASYYSCFYTDSTLWNAGQWVLGLDHGQSYFQHAIMILQDMYNSGGGSSSDYFDDYYIYIGDDPNYTLNTPCAANPIMASGTSPWLYGTDTWCNLQGRYTHIVKEAASTTGANSVSLCHIGVLGTQYIRDVAAITDITVMWGVTTSFDVQDIYSAYEIGNVLDIQLRQATGLELPFITFTDMVTYIQVNITPLISDLGIHTLTLESFDNNGGVFSTLKTDIVQITVTEFVRDTPVDTYFIITRGDLLSFNVENCYSSVVVFPVVINLRQPTDGTELTWVSFVEFTGYTQVDVDTLLTSVAGKYTLTLYSYDISGYFDASVNLMTDLVNLYVTDYVHTTALVQTITIRQDKTRTYIVPHCESNVPEILADLGIAVSINLRQQPGFELAWVSISEVTAGQSDVFINPAAELVGIYTLFLESYDKDAIAPQPTLRSDQIQIEITNYIRTAEIESPVTITQGDILVVSIPHCFSEEGAITPALDINLQQPMLGYDLSFATIDDSPADHTLITIDTAGQTVGVYNLHLWSYSTINPGPSVLMDDFLLEDILVIEIPGYYHVVPLADTVQVRKDELLTIIIPNCVPTIAISAIQDVNLRQQVGAELPFVTLAEYAGSTHITIDAAGLESASEWELIIESFDSLLPVEEQSVLRFDIITIQIQPKACDVTQEAMDAFGAAHVDDYNLFAQLGIGWEQVLYHNLYDEAFYEVFGLDDPDRESCGSLTVDLVSPYPFLGDFPTLKTFVLQPDWTDEEGIYTEAYQTFTINGFSCSIPITATIWDCDLISVGFSKTTMEVEYEIGSGPLDKSLPSVKQVPECNLIFSDFLIGQTDTSNDATLAAVVFDNGNFKIDSSDYTLDTHTLRYYVNIDTSIIATEPLIFDITFTKPPPQLSAEPTPPPLTCSQADKDWAFTLPNVANPSIQTVNIEMTTQTSDFKFNESTKTVTIADNVKQSVLSGAYCPEQDITLEFVLTSNILGEAGLSFTISVTGEAAGNQAGVGGFQGYVAGQQKSGDFQQKEEEANKGKLEVDKVTFSVLGKLKIRFNRKILVPDIQIYNDEKSEKSEQSTTDVNLNEEEDEKKRRLNINKTQINEAIELRVSSDDPDDDYDKTIKSYELKAINEKEMDIQVTFNDHKAITDNVQDPDLLEVKFLLPGLFLDAVTLLPLDQSSYKSEVELAPQLLQDEMQEIQAMAEAAQTVGMFATVFELAMCFLLGKALESMWTLIYAMQFLVFIGMWNFRQPKHLSFFFYEMKRIALGEFVDDLDIEQRILDWLEWEGMDEDEMTDIGYDRFGSPDLFQSLGITFYISISAAVFLLLIALLIIFIGRRSNWSQKNLGRLQKLEDQIFYNPVIRVSFLSALKMNLVPVLVFKLIPDRKLQLYTAIAIIVVLNLTPLHYAKVLHKRRSELDTEYQIRKIGSLYDTRNVRSDKNHSTWLYPITFFYRRLAFGFITIYLFSRPNIQMIAHQAVSLMIIVYISFDDQMYKDKPTRFVEISTEAMLFVACIFIQMMMLPLDDTSMDEVSYMIYASVGLLIIVNISFVIYNVRLNCKDKKRLKHREQRRQVWENAWKQVEKKRPSRFAKPREYKAEEMKHEEGGVQLDRKAIALRNLMKSPLPAIEEESSRSRNEKSSKAYEDSEMSEMDLKITESRQTTTVGLIKPNPEFIRKLYQMSNKINNEDKRQNINNQFDTTTDDPFATMFSTALNNQKSQAKQKRIGYMQQATQNINASQNQKIGVSIRPLGRMASERMPDNQISELAFSPEQPKSTKQAYDFKQAQQLMANPHQPREYSSQYGPGGFHIGIGNDILPPATSTAQKPHRYGTMKDDGYQGPPKEVSAQGGGRHRYGQMREDDVGPTDLGVSGSNVIEAAADELLQTKMAEQPNFHHISASNNAASSLALANSRQTNHGASMFTPLKVRENLDDLLHEIDSCYSQVARSEQNIAEQPHHQHSNQLTNNSKAGAEPQINTTANANAHVNMGSQGRKRANNYFDDSQDIDDFISEIDSYLTSQKK